MRIDKYENTVLLDFVCNRSMLNVHIKGEKYV